MESAQADSVTGQTLWFVRRCSTLTAASEGASVTRISFWMPVVCSVGLTSFSVSPSITGVPYGPVSGK